MTSAGTQTHSKPESLVSGADEPVAAHRTARDYYIILRERLFLVLPFALLIGFAYGYCASHVTPLYSAAATIQFERPRTIVTSQGVYDPSVHSDEDLDTAVALLNSRSLRMRVAKSFTSDEREIILRPYRRRLAPGSSLPAIEDALGSVNCAEVGRSYLIRIEVTHEDGLAAAIVANRFAREFIDEQQDELGGADDNAVTDLKGRVRELQAESEVAQEKLDDYARLHEIGSLEKSIDLVADNLTTVNAALMNARLLSLAAADVARRVDAAAGDRQKLLEIAAIAGYGAIPSLRACLSELRQKWDDDSYRYLERHPVMVDLVHRMEDTRKRLDEEVARASAGAHATLSVQRENVASLASEYADLQGQERQLRELSVRYQSLKSQAEAARSNYGAVLDRLNQTQTTKTFEKVPLRLLDSAVPGTSSLTASRRQVIRTSVGLGILTFLATCLGLSSVDDRVKSAWDVERGVGTRLVGIVPNLGLLNGRDRYASVCRGKLPAEVEPFLGIYAALRISAGFGHPRSLLVTSTLPGEGKTLVATNLALAFAHHGKRVLLVDCDLRRPSIHRRFKRPGDRGLVAWMNDGARLDEPPEENAGLGIAGVGENLWILPAGGASSSPTRIFESPAFAGLLRSLKDAFDLVVIDSPPMASAADPLLIAERTDDTLYVCRFKLAARRQVRLHVGSLHGTHKPILGVVLNGLPRNRVGHYSDYHPAAYYGAKRVDAWSG